MEKTRLSNKGQVVIPKAIRTLYGWESGLEFLIVHGRDGITLKPLNPFAETTIDDVIGCVGYNGPRRSLQEMEAAIATGAREQK